MGNKLDARVAEVARAVVKALPSGAGFDSAWTRMDPSRRAKEVRELVARVRGAGMDARTGIVLVAARGGYHWMNDAGYYDGWAYLRVVVAYSVRTGEAVDWCVYFADDEGTRKVLRKDPELADNVEERIHAGTAWPRLRTADVAGTTGLF